MIASLIWLAVAILIAFLGTFGMEWLKPALFRNGVSSVLFGTGALFMFLSFCGITVDDEAMWGAYIIAHVLAYVMVALSVLDVMFWRRKEIPSEVWVDSERFCYELYTWPIEEVVFGYTGDYINGQKVLIIGTSPHPYRKGSVIVDSRYED
jgi:hypothetical protein